MSQLFSNIDESLEILKNANPDTKAQWGIMSLHNMIEHLGLVLKASNGKLKAVQKTKEENLPMSKMFLMGPMDLPRGFKAPGLPENEPLPLVTNSIEEAIKLLKIEVDNFYLYYGLNRDAKEIHPIFGPLNLAEWEQFHNKHFKHHFTQFGLVG
jgi:oxepin-CoA hydrolase/3-oxo-5,6-dehydrosuberyl-CoA semialdehyde dehydrogenase